jgi:hypothetical protein
MQGSGGEIRQQTLVWPLPKSVKTSHERKVTILWNKQVRTNVTIPNIKLDIIIRDNKQRTWMLMHVAIFGDRNVIKKRSWESFEI